MSPSRKVPRYAHSDGHTAICYSTDGKNLITCGSEGDIRIWHGFEDDDPTEKCVGEKAFAVVQAEDKLYVGTDHNNVQAFTFPDAELDRICTRFTAPVTCISIVKDWLAAGSSDMKVNVFNLTSGAEKVISCHNGPILEVALDPQLEYLATSCCDGLVRVFSMSSLITSTVEPAPIQSWPGFIPRSNDFETSPVLCRVAWGPQGRSLAIPTAGKVHVYARGGWEKEFTLAFDECQFQVARFSPCDLYLAAAGGAGDIAVWRLSDRSLIHHSAGQTKAICSLEWNPAGPSELAYCDQEGQLGLVEGLLEPASPRMTNGHASPHPLPLDEIGEATLIDDMDEQDFTDDDNAISLEKIKSQSGFPTEGEGSAQGSRSPSPSIADEGRQTPMSGVYPPVASVPLTELQPPFQPTATPKHFQYRFMVYNDVGMVRHTNTEEENSIDIEFHDSAVHHSFRINNVAGHTLAALSEKALVLASERDEDKPSKLSCIVINSWDGSKEWSVEFPTEDILAVTAGSTFVACASDRRLLRVFTIGGVQREVLSLPGPVVCLNAQANVLLAVYHAGQGAPGDQNLSFSLYHIGSLHRSYGSFPLPLSPSSTLRWAGFSEEGSVMSLDSDCVLQLCCNYARSTVWRPVCFMDDLTKGKSDHYFVVGVTESSHTVRCILCKGSYYPATVPRPILTQVSWKIPLCELGGPERTELEETFWRKQLALSSVPSHKSEELGTVTKELIASAVKLFALSCKTDHDLRAIELCEMFANPQFLQLAARYANSTGKASLAEKVGEVKSGGQSLTAREEREEIFESNNRYPEQMHNSQSDMFGDDTYQPSPESNNIILAMKQKAVVVKPQNVMLGRVNPFKRNNSNVDERPKSDVIAQMTSQSQQKTLTPPVETKPAEKSTKEKVAGSKPSIKFTEWFAKEKENLEQEFPELDKPALNKVAMKRFKETMVHAQKTTPPQTNSVRNFFMSKKPTESVQDGGQTQDCNTQDTIMIPSSQDLDSANNENNAARDSNNANNAAKEKKEANIENENVKKRKLDKMEEKEEASNPKKPLTAANKLKAFSFGK